MSFIPSQPDEAQMTDDQRKAVRRIQMLIREHFKKGMLAIIYSGTDAKLHIQVINNCASREQSLDLAHRALQEVQRAETGIITAISTNEKRIVAL